jgi:hypothetical protein
MVMIETVKLSLRLEALVERIGLFQRRGTGSGL